MVVGVFATGAAGLIALLMEYLQSGFRWWSARRMSGDHDDPVGATAARYCIKRLLAEGPGGRLPLTLEHIGRNRPDPAQIFGCRLMISAVAWPPRLLPQPSVRLTSDDGTMGNLRKPDE